MIVSFEKTRNGFCVSGEWRTAAAHEYAIYADRAGRWAAVQVVDTGSGTSTPRRRRGTTSPPPSCQRLTRF